MATSALFIQYLGTNPTYFFAVILVVIISVVLHELAHGWAAMSLGDDTPVEMGRMTGNPLVHMGAFSLIALFIAGIAWGQMPINPSRLRGKYGEAKVALAGPAMNLTLGVLCAVGLALMIRYGPPAPSGQSSPAGSIRLLLHQGAIMNFVLMMFNLVPVPPLDGSHILANFHRGYARLISDPAKQGIFLLAFIFIFISAPVLFGWSDVITDQIVHFVRTGLGG